MKYVVLIIVCAALLLTQKKLSRKRLVAFTFIVPVISALGMGVLLYAKNGMLTSKDIIVMLLLAACFLVSGFLERNRNRNAELEKMQKTDLDVKK